MNLANSSLRRLFCFSHVLTLGLLFLIATSTATSAQPGKQKGHSKHPGKFNRAYHASGAPANQAYPKSWKKHANLVVVPLAFNQPGFASPYLAGDWQGSDPVIDYGYHRSIFAEFDSPRVWDNGSVFSPPYLDQLPLHNVDTYHHQSMRPPIEARAATAASNPLAYPTIHTKARARSAQHRAESAFRNGDYDLASSLARQVVTLDSANGIAWLFAAHTSFAVGDYDQSARDLRAAINILPAENWDFIVENYQHFYGQNDFVRQMEQLNNFLIERPLHVSARIVRGHQWAGLGHLDSAYHDLSIALSRRPKDETILKLLERYNPAGVIDRQSDFIQQPAPWLNDPPSLMPLGNRPPEAESEGILDTPSSAPGQPAMEALPAPDTTDSVETLDEFQRPERQN